MRKRLIFTITITILLFAITACRRQEAKAQVYSFNGETEHISIDNGLIIATDDLEKFVGGDIRLKGDKKPDIENYSSEYFFYKDGNKESILIKTAGSKYISQRETVSSQLGSISSQNLFYGNDLDSIKKSLEFSLSGQLISGESFEYTLTPHIEKVY